VLKCIKKPSGTHDNPRRNKSRGLITLEVDFRSREQPPEPTPQIMALPYLPTNHMQNGHYLGGWLRWLLPRPKVHLKCNESSRLVTPRIIVRPTRFLYTFQHFACSKLRLPSLLSWHFAYDLSVNMAEAILEIILNVMEFFIGQILWPSMGLLN